jgi:uncharacterized membrane protein HdeD (DUF308 family)
MESLMSLLPQNEDENIFKLSLTNRMYGFIGCTVVGLLSSLLGVITLFVGKYVSFSVMYSIGNIALLAGTMFIIGPMSQFKNMFSKYRYIATIVFLLSLIGTFVVAFAFHNALLSLICVIIQSCAYTWYVLSYIPFGRDMCWSCVKNTANNIV